MQLYDLTVITENSENVAGTKKKIEERGGAIQKIIDFGNKPFAYPINKKLEGFYTTVIFSAEPDKIDEISRDLKLSDKIIRHLIVKTSEENVKKLELLNKPSEPIKPELKKPAPKVSTQEKPPKEKPAIKVKPEDEKLRQKTLDEKLKQILDE